MSSEIQLQTALVKLFKNQGAHVFKASSRFRLGILDLYVKMPNKNGFWIECKHAIMPFRNTTPLKINLSEHQRLFMRREQKAGGGAVWLLGMRLPDPTNPRRKTWYCRVGDNPEVKQISIEDFLSQSIYTNNPKYFASYVSAYANGIEDVR